MGAWLRPHFSFSAFRESPQPLPELLTSKDGNHFAAQQLGIELRFFVICYRVFARQLISDFGYRSFALCSLPFLLRIANQNAMAVFTARASVRPDV